MVRGSGPWVVVLQWEEGCPRQSHVTIDTKNVMEKVCGPHNPAEGQIRELRDEVRQLREMISGMKIGAGAGADDVQGLLLSPFSYSHTEWYFLISLFDAREYKHAQRTLL